MMCEIQRFSAKRTSRKVRGILAPKYLLTIISVWILQSSKFLNFFNKSKKFGIRKNLNFNTMNKRAMIMKIIMTKSCLFVCLFVCLFTDPTV